MQGYNIMSKGKQDEYINFWKIIKQRLENGNNKKMEEKRQKGEYVSIKAKTLMVID